MPARRTRSRLAQILAVLVALLASLLIAGGSPVGAAPDAAERGEEASEVREPLVTYDHYSLKIDGERVLMWAGEFHYYRLPSPDLWRDILEKIRAAGFNGVSLYFNWSYHSPRSGVYDFTGVRDVDRLLRMADELGLYVVARPGPYINAEVSGGGLPAWLKNVPGRARSSDAGYTQAYREWTSRINAIIARHQIDRGGSVILYNVENEYGVNVDAQYMEDLQRDARADGITVPITHNNCCGGGLANWSSGKGAVQIPGVDDYPQSFDCANPETAWGVWGDGVTRRLREDAPVYAAEYQAGAIDLNRAGHEGCRQLTGPRFMKVFYKSNLISSGATMFGYYMTHGGTNWGWLPQPNDVYTSYDYGAAITETRGLTTKYDEFKRQGYFVTSVPPLVKTDPAPAPVTDTPTLHAEARANPDTGTQFVIVRHPDRRTSAVVDATLDWQTPDGRYSLPVRVTGRDAKIFLAGYDLGGQRLVLSTSEMLTHLPIDGRDVAMLYGREGEPGTTILRYRSKPSVRVLDEDVSTAYDPATGDLRITSDHRGLQRVLVTGGGRRPMLLLLGSDEAAADFWRMETGRGQVLVRGTELVRSATVSRNTLELHADIARAGEVEVFAPAGVRRLVVNGKRVAVRPTTSGSLLGRVDGPVPVKLPELKNWRSRAEAPEAKPGFDDSAWTVADKTTSESPFVPKTLPVLYADDYGFHHGHVWYRGRFTATGSESTVDLNAITGKHGIYQVWLNGRYLGSASGGVQGDSDTPRNPDPGPGQFEVPDGLLTPGEPATLAVLVGNMGHNDDWIADDNRFKQPRGLVGADVVGSDAPISWRIQGARGGQDLPDVVRGPLNNGGLYGERAGWHLPGSEGAGWRAVSSPSQRPLEAGVAWHRTTFSLHLPKGQDVPVMLKFADDTERRYRVLVFLNGWNVGQYLNGVPPQSEFYLPEGLLRARGKNTLALAVISRDESESGLGAVELVAAGNVRGGVPVRDVPGR